MRKIDRQEIADLGIEEVVLLEPDYLDEALIGISANDQAVYSYSALIELLAKNENISVEDARDHVDLNIIGAYVGANQPIIIDTEFYDYK